VEVHVNVVFLIFFAAKKYASSTEMFFTFSVAKDEGVGNARGGGK
jgi:hypothetical protein